MWGQQGSLLVFTTSWRARRAPSLPASTGHIAARNSSSTSEQSAALLLAILRGRMERSSYSGHDCCQQSGAGRALLWGKGEAFSCAASMPLAAGWLDSARRAVPPTTFPGLGSRMPIALGPRQLPARHCTLRH